MQTSQSGSTSRPAPNLDSMPSPEFTPNSDGTRVGRYVLAGTLASAAVGLALCFGDPIALTALGYLPILVVKAIFAGSNDLALMWQPALLRSALTLGANIALAAAAYAVLPRKPIFRGVRRKTVTRIRDIAVATAIVVPTGYAITRLAWFFGIPLGISREFMKEVESILVNGAGLAAFAVLGAFLTWGLTRPWGATFGRWTPVLRGRRVPIGLARNSAIAVGFAVLSAGGYFIRSAITGNISIAPAGAGDQIAAWLPEVFWPPWGLALIAAALAYSELRRRDEHDAARDGDHDGRAPLAP